MSMDNENICVICTKTFANNTELKNHFEHVHEGQYTCQVCDKLVASKRNYIRHMEMFHDQKERCKKIASHVLAVPE